MRSNKFPMWNDAHFELKFFLRYTPVKFQNTVTIKKR